MNKYLFNYHESKEISGYPFYTLLMAAMRQADTINRRLLANAFPDVWEELQDRYNAPGGIIPGDPDYQEGTEQDDTDHS